MKVLVSCRQMQSCFDAFADEFARLNIEVELPPVVQQLDEQQLLAIIDRFDGVIAGDDHFTGSVLRQGSRLRVISKWGVGVDNIDLAVATEQGIRVTNTPGMFADEVADVCMGYLIMLTRHLHTIDSAVRTGAWPKTVGRSLAGLTIGIVGLGSIGRALGRRALVSGMRVIGTDIRSAAAEDVRQDIEAVDIAQLLERADVISLNCPLTPDSRHLMSRAAFASLRPGAYLINTARGPLVDEDALVEALLSLRLGGVALDVFEDEPLAAEHPLRGMPNVILGSHNASNTAEAVMRTSQHAVANLLEGLR